MADDDVAYDDATLSDAATGARDRRPATGEDADRKPTLTPPPTLPAGETSAQKAPTLRERPARTLRPAPTDDDAAWLADLDLGDFRPKAGPELPSMPAVDRAVGGGPKAMQPAAAEATKPSRGAPQGEENIEAMLRRLADDISRGRKTADPAAPTRTAAGVRPAATAAPANRADHRVAASAGSKTQPPPLPPRLPMPAGPMPTTPVPGMPAMAAKAPTAQPAPAASARTQTAAGRLAAIADALSDERIEVFLETINGLDDYRARHYEVSVRLKLADGETLDNGRLVSATRGSGLLPLIEAVKVSSTKRIAVQMIRRGRSGDFFSLVDGEALASGQFGEDMETIIGGDQALAARLVLAFSQADLRGFTTAQWESLREIAGLGFRFSVEDITDLDMDFEKLASNGFAFAKLDAEVFLDGLPIENSRVPAADICRYLSGAGLALIVGEIRDEATRAKILGFGALFGQGALFGAPRPVRSDVLRQREAAGAAR